MYSVENENIINVCMAVRLQCCIKSLFQSLQFYIREHELVNVKVPHSSQVFYCLSIHFILFIRMFKCSTMELIWYPLQAILYTVSFLLLYIYLKRVHNTFYKNKMNKMREIKWLHNNNVVTYVFSVSKSFAVGWQHIIIRYKSFL